MPLSCLFEGVSGKCFQSTVSLCTRDVEVLGRI